MSTPKLCKVHGAIGVLRVRTVRNAYASHQLRLKIEDISHFMLPALCSARQHDARHMAAAAANVTHARLAFALVAAVLQLDQINAILHVGTAAQNSSTIADDVSASCTHAVLVYCMYVRA